MQREQHMLQETRATLLDEQTAVTLERKALSIKLAELDAAKVCPSLTLAAEPYSAPVPHLPRHMHLPLPSYLLPPALMAMVG